MISDREIWACAQQQIAQHGAKAPEKIAERIGALAIAEDAEGVAVWKRIAGAANDLAGFTPARVRH